MLDEILDGDPTYKIVANAVINDDGSITMTNASIELETTVLREGSSWNKANVLPDDLVALLKINPDINPQVKDAFLALYGILGNSFAEASWEEIEDIIEKGYEQVYYNIGDTRTEVLSNGEIITIRIEDFAHDKLADGSGYAPMTLAMENCFDTQRPINSTNTNAGSWGGADLRDDMSALKALLPTSLQALIRTVTKTTQAGSMSSELTTTNDDLWLFSCTELGIVNSNYSPGGEGTAYPLFTDNASRIKTIDGSGIYWWWWTRSPDLGNTATWISVYASGIPEEINPSASAGICVGFCIGSRGEESD